MLHSTCCVAILLCLTAEGFTVVNPSIRQPKPVQLQRHISQRQRTSISSPWPRFAAPVSNDSKTFDSKVQEMAKFLAMQLLEKALKEVGKEDGGTKMSVEDIQKLAGVFQKPVVETMEAQEKLAPIWETAGEAAEELLNEEVTTSKAAVESEEKEVNPVVSYLDTLGASQTADTLPDIVAAEVVPETIAEDLLETEAFEDDEEEETAIQNTEEVVDPPTVLNETAEELLNEPETAVVDGPSVSETASSSAEATPLASVARFPDVISKDFGRSLEVVTSAVPPLKATTVETNSPSPVEQVEEQSGISAEIASTDIKTLDEGITQESDPPAAVFTVGPSGAVIVDKPLEEPTTDVAVEEESTIADVTVEETTTADVATEEPTSEGAAAEQTSDADETDVRDNSSPDADSPTQGKFLEKVRGAFSRERTEPGLTKETADDAATAPAVVEVVESSRAELIRKARQQPKSPEEEAKLAAKYGRMSLEDRAFTILYDLGMIEISEDLTAEPENSEEKMDAVEETEVEVSAEDPEAVDSEKPPGKRQRVLQSIRTFLSHPESTSSRSNVLPSGARGNAMHKARRQPKSPREEAKLAARYGGMPLEERAFAIIHDLRMI